MYLHPKVSRKRGPPVFRSIYNDKVAEGLLAPRLSWWRRLMAFLLGR
jgi:hypothetical protein